MPSVRLRSAAKLCLAALVVGCGGGGSDTRVSLADANPSGGYWAIQAECTGGRLHVQFDPGERLSVAGLGHATSEEIAVDCGEPERVAISDEALRRRTATPTGADLATPTSEPMRLSCVAEGSLSVEAHPVWAQHAIVGGALRVERGGHTIVDGAILTAEPVSLPSALRWWRALCTPE